jgi:hypothetical protein
LDWPIWLKFTTIRNAAECQLNQCFVLWCRLVPSCPCHMDGTWKSAVCSPRVPCGWECALDSGQFLRGGMPAVSVDLFDQAAWVVLIKPTSWDRHGLKPWLEAAQEAAASQRPRHHARQQARSHCLERPCSWSNFRGEQDSGRVIKASRRNCEIEFDGPLDRTSAGGWAPIFASRERQLWGSSRRNRLFDFKAHQVFSDFQRAVIGLPDFCDEIADSRRWHLLAGEKNEMRAHG